MSLWATAVHYKSYAGGEVGREKSHLRSRCVEASGGWHSSGTKDLMKKEGMTSSFSGTDLFGTMGQKQPSWTENRKKKTKKKKQIVEIHCRGIVQLSGATLASLSPAPQHSQPAPKARAPGVVQEGMGQWDSAVERGAHLA